MRWYAVIICMLLGIAYTSFDRASRMFEMSTTIVPSTKGDFLALAAFVCAAGIGFICAQSWK